MEEYVTAVIEDRVESTEWMQLAALLSYLWRTEYYPIKEARKATGATSAPALVSHAAPDQK